MRVPHARTLLALTALLALFAINRSLFARLSEPAYGPYPINAISHFDPTTLPTGSHYGPRPEYRTLSEAERVASEIARTDRTLAEAEGRVARNGSGSSRDDLRHGRERQTEARAAMEQSFLARAMRLTLEARAYAKSALTKLGPAENDPQVVARAIDQTDDALHRAKDVLEDGAARKLRRRYAALETEQEEARALYRRGAIRGAYARTREVRDGVLELLRQCENLPVSKDVARKALRRAEEAMAQTQKETRGRSSAGAQRLERDASLQLAKARSAYGRKSYRDALLHAKLVERHLQRAMEFHRLAATQTG
jgi:hypothetical protein